MRIAVAGGTGAVGRHVVEQLARAGMEPVSLSRREGTDLTTGSGVAGRLAGASAVIDCLSVATTRRSRAVDFFTTTTRVLLDAEEEAGVPHHIALSIVGIDRASSFGYYQGKLAQERLLASAGRPSTILRATQFHEFALQTLDRTRVGPVTVVPRMLSAPVAAHEVAAALVELALGEPLRRTVEIAGPEERQMVDLVRAVARVRGHRGPVLDVRVPGSAGRAMAAGALVATDPWRRGAETFDTWLASLARR